LKDKSVKILNFLDLPVNLINSLPQIEINGNIELVVDGINEITEYNENIICITARQIKITIFGVDLQIRYISESIAGVTGKINSISFADI